MTGEVVVVEIEVCQEKDVAITDKVMTADMIVKAKTDMTGLKVGTDLAETAPERERIV